MASLATPILINFAMIPYKSPPKTLGVAILRPSIRTHPQFWERIQIWNPPEVKPLTFGIREFSEAPLVLLGIFFFKNKLLWVSFFSLKSFTSWAIEKKQATKGWLGYYEGYFLTTHV